MTSAVKHAGEGIFFAADRRVLRADHDPLHREIPIQRKINAAEAVAPRGQYRQILHADAVMDGERIILCARSAPVIDLDVEAG